ncbi:hypothetical protein T492DRAFT_518352 [Pavlovales sp. CCMP2436]|nr:hypothetical protein T492DRAFT_518352 [Pavlovales sp. CCMP2436]
MITHNNNHHVTKKKKKRSSCSPTARGRRPSKKTKRRASSDSGNHTLHIHHNHTNQNHIKKKKKKTNQPTKRRKKEEKGRRAPCNSGNNRYHSLYRQSYSRMNHSHHKNHPHPPRPSAGPPPSAAVYDLGDDDEPPPSTLRSSLQLPSTLPVSVLPAPGFFRAQFGVPSLLGTGSMPLPLPLPLSLAGLMDAGSMGSGSMLLPAAGLLLPSMQPALPLPAHAQSAAEGAGGGAPSAAGLLSGGVTRNGVTAQHMTRVLADACAMAAESRQILSLDASPQAHPAYRQIHDLFLSLEDNPRSADALCFAHEQALTLLGHGRPFGELQPAASPPAASLFALDPSFPPLFLAAAGGVGGVGVGAQDGAAAGARIYAAFAVAPLPALLPPPPVARAPPPPIARVQMPPAVRAAGPGEDPDNPICLD